MAKVSRPAQGDNATRPLNRPRPAYKPSIAPSVVSLGSVQYPKKNPRSRQLSGKDASDATPKIVKL